MAKERIEFGPVARRKKDGKLGARAFIHREDNGWDGHYALDTHGMNEAQVAEAIAAKRAHHSNKAARLGGFAQSVHNTEFSVGTETWRVLDCTLFEMSTGVELFVQAAPVSGAGFDKRRLVRTTGQYSSIQDVPSDDAILRTIRAAVEEKSSDEEKHRRFSAQVKALAGGG